MHALRVNEGLQNQIMTFERQCWKTEQYSRRECIEIVRNPDTTNETKVCNLIEMAAGISITLESLNACHCLPSNQNDILIIKFLRKTDAEMVLSKKSKGKGFNHRSIGIEKAKMFINESLCRTLTSYGVNAKHYGQRNGLKPSGLTMTKMKIRIKPEGAVSRITHITDLQKLFPSYDFQLNKFPITSHH